MISEILDTTILSKNMRMNLPEVARVFLGVKPGDKIVVIRENDEIIIRSALK